MKPTIPQIRADGVTGELGDGGGVAGQVLPEVCDRTE